MSKLSEQDAKYLKMLLTDYVTSSKVTFFVNPSVKQQVDNTKDEKRRAVLLVKFHELHFTEFNLTVFPFHFPATFISKEQANFIDQLCTKHPKLLRDQKIIADAGFNDNIDVLLTTDKKLANQVRQVDHVKFQLPKELWEDLTKLHR
ncbi:MAG: hypothetical protein V1894_02670 [Chloroflexota bacterium]